MAGHSQFKNIMYRKGAQDAKRAKLFAKIIREITVAAKTSGIDPNSNPRLRAALSSARSANMPKDNIDRALKKAAGGDDGVNYEEVRYEGYGPSGIAVIVEALTDNRNRTAAEVRSAFNKHGGNLGENGSVSFQFTRMGSLTYPSVCVDFDRMFEHAAEAGAENVEREGENYLITCAADNFATVRDHLTKIYDEPSESKIIWQPNVLSSVDLDAAQILLKLLDILEDNDDVQQVYTNADISDEIAAKLAG